MAPSLLWKFSRFLILSRFVWGSYGTASASDKYRHPFRQAAERESANFRSLSRCRGSPVSISASGQAKETPSAGSGVAPPDGEWRLAQIRQLKERCRTQLDAVLAELDSFKRLSWPIHDRLMQTDITTLACSDMSDVWSLAPYRTAATPTSKNW